MPASRMEWRTLIAVSSASIRSKGILIRPVYGYLGAQITRALRITSATDIKRNGLALHYTALRAVRALHARLSPRLRAPSALYRGVLAGVMPCRVAWWLRVVLVARRL